MLAIILGFVIDSCAKSTKNALIISLIVGIVFVVVVYGLLIPAIYGNQIEGIILVMGAIIDLLLIVGIASLRARFKEKKQRLNNTSAFE